METGIEVTYTRMGNEKTMTVLKSKVASELFGLSAIAESMSPDPSEGKSKPRPPNTPIHMSIELDNVLTHDCAK
jgi:hypothetical protein